MNSVAPEEGSGILGYIASLPIGQIPVRHLSGCGSGI
jgi:hypothetical protein